MFVSHHWCTTDHFHNWLIFRPHHLHSDRCGPLLPMLHICVSVCWAHQWAVQKWLNQSRCRLGADSCEYMGTMYKWEPRSDKSIHSRKGWQNGDAAFCQVTLQLKQNNAKQIQIKSKTNPKQNKIVLFWVCFSTSCMWNKTLKPNKSGLSVNHSINFAQQHCCLVNIMSSVTRRLWGCAVQNCYGYSFRRCHR